MTFYNCLFLAILLTSCHTAKQTATTTSGYIKVNDARLYYQSTGNGDPLMLLHAGFLEGSMWQQQVAAFGKKYQVITVDLPAHGKTAKGDSLFLIQDALKVVLDSLKIRKASFAGVSLGAVVVTDFILAYPERVAKAVLVSPGINGWDRKYGIDSVVLQYHKSLTGALSSKDTAGAAEVFTQYWGDGPYRHANDWNGTVRNYIYTTTLMNMLRHKVSGWPRLAEPPAMERINEIKVPVLIIYGNKDMNYSTQASSVLQQAIRGARKVMQPDVAHLLNMESPRKFNKIVLAFLKE